jgi:hypothetical protein
MQASLSSSLRFAKCLFQFDCRQVSYAIISARLTEPKVLSYSLDCCRDVVYVVNDFTSAQITVTLEAGSVNSIDDATIITIRLALPNE